MANEIEIPKLAAIALAARSARRLQPHIIEGGDWGNKMREAASHILDLVERAAGEELESSALLFEAADIFNQLNSQWRGPLAGAHNISFETSRKISRERAAIRAIGLAIQAGLNLVDGDLSSSETYALASIQEIARNSPVLAAVIADDVEMLRDASKRYKWNDTTPVSSAFFAGQSAALHLNRRSVSRQPSGRCVNRRLLYTDYVANT